MNLGLLGKAWDFFQPPDFDQLLDALNMEDVEEYSKWANFVKSLERYGNKISWTFFAILLFVLFAFSPWGFVLAGNQAKQIDDKLKTTEERLSGIETQNAAMKSSLDELVAEKVANGICRIVVRLRKEVDVTEIVALRNDLTNAQKRYKALTTENYPETRCL